MKFRRPFAIVAALILLAMPLGIAGCQELQNAELRWTQNAAELRRTLEDLKATRNAATQAAATLPAADPIRAKIETAVAKFDAQAEVLESLVKSVEQGRPDSGLPGALGVFGPWGTIAGYGLLAGWGIYQGRKAAAATQTLQEVGPDLMKTVEFLGPRTDEQKEAIARLQGPKTKAFVSAVKGE